MPRLALLRDTARLVRLALLLDTARSYHKVNIDLMRVTCLDIDIAPSLTRFGTSGSTAASDDLSDDDVPFS